MLTTMSNWSKASKLDDATKDQAALVKTIWPQLDVDQRDDFMKRYHATKASKNVGWIRNFEESLKKQKTNKAESTEKHFTRHDLLKQMYCSWSSYMRNNKIIKL